MKLFIGAIQFFLFFSFIKTFHAIINDPTMDALFHTIDANVSPGNPYFGDLSAHVGDDSKSLFVTFPVKKTLPEDMLMQIKCNFGQVPFIDVEMSLCDSLADPAYGTQIWSFLIPADEAPKQCPFVANENYEFFNYTPDSRIVPPTAPDGDFQTTIKLYQPDAEDVYVVILITGEITHDKLKKLDPISKADSLPKVPGFGR